MPVYVKRWWFMMAGTNEQCILILLSFSCPCQRELICTRRQLNAIQCKICSFYVISYTFFHNFSFINFQTNTGISFTSIQCMNAMIHCQLLCYVYSVFGMEFDPCVNELNARLAIVSYEYRPRSTFFMAPWCIKRAWSIHCWAQSLGCIRKFPTDLMVYLFNWTSESISS